MIKFKSPLKSINVIIFSALMLLLMASCGKKNVDNLAAYRNMSDVQIFNKGEKELVKHNWRQAVKTLQALDALYPFGPYSVQAELDLIYAYYKKGDVAAGLAEADRYIRLYPRSEHVDYVYYMKGLFSDQQGLSWTQRRAGIDPAEHDLSSKKQAYLAFNEVVTRFPNSAYAADSALRMVKIRNLFAHKQVMLAEFYLKRKAYVAAINRASYVVKHYNGAPEVIVALEVLVKAYRGAGLNQMADNTLKVMEASYPKAPQLEYLKKR